MAFSRVQVEGQMSFFGNERGDLRDAGDTKVINFNVAVQHRKKEGDQWINGRTLWKRCSAFGRTAENIAETFKKGDLVLLFGEERAESYQNKDGEQVDTSSIRVDSIGPAIRWDSAESHREPSKGGGSNGGGNSNSGSSSSSSSSKKSESTSDNIDFNNLNFDDEDENESPF